MCENLVGTPDHPTFFVPGDDSISYIAGKIVLNDST
jgi:hypothetical protein